MIESTQLALAYAGAFCAVGFAALGSAYGCGVAAALSDRLRVRTAGCAESSLSGSASVFCTGTAGFRLSGRM